MTTQPPNPYEIYELTGMSVWEFARLRSKRRTDTAPDLAGREREEYIHEKEPLYILRSEDISR